MECIDIEKLFNEESINVVTEAEIPFNVCMLIKNLIKEGYFQGLNGLNTKEIVGTLILAGICTCVPKEKWSEIIPVIKE